MLNRGCHFFRISLWDSQTRLNYGAIVCTFSSGRVRRCNKFNISSNSARSQLTTPRAFADCRRRLSCAVVPRAAVLPSSAATGQPVQYSSEFKRLRAFPFYAHLPYFPSPFVIAADHRSCPWPVQIILKNVIKEVYFKIDMPSAPARRPRQVPCNVASYPNAVCILPPMNSTLG